MPPRGKEFADHWSNPARGMRCHNHIKTCVSLDPEMHAEIRARAVAHGTSFAEQVRLLCEWGLEDTKDSTGTRSPKNGADTPSTVPGHARSQRSK